MQLYNNFFMIPWEGFLTPGPFSPPHAMTVVLCCNPASRKQAFEKSGW